jgi:DNA-binding FadR family transcriptional regulator
MGFNEITRSPVYLQVAAQLREAIMSGELASGEALPTERALAESFGASRASVREALRVLQAQGLITSGGAPAPSVVADGTEPSAREALVALLRLNRVALDDLVELRCLIESAALVAAAESPDPEPLAEARRALDEMEGPDVDIESFDEADVRFHVSLVRASGNEAMHLVMLAVRDAVSRHLLEALRAQANPERTLGRLRDEHAAILTAVEGGEGDRAATLVERHIRRFYRTVDG